jgi:O-antigen biosynthesis protein
VTERPALANAGAERAAAVDVIVPVYRGFATTMRCLHSVLASSARTPYELVVIDDASPEPELSAALDELAAAGRIRLVRNAENAGFVRSANHGMGLHPGRDVVLLNSDTEVFGDWLDRLRAAAGAGGVGTVTPFSNNAEICSYPRFMTDNDAPLELTGAELDALFARTNRGLSVDLPTAVGFCMLITRACLNDVGAFDEARFGMGYGEENDFCWRALQLGWRNLLAADVFVRHRGGVSFGDSKRDRIAAATATLGGIHPDIFEAFGRFIRDDPVLPLRRRVDVARVRRRARRTVVLVSHDRAGATDRHAADEARRVAADGEGVLIARGVEGTEPVIRFESPDLDLPNLPAIDLRTGLDELTAFLTAVRAVQLHVHHLAGFPPAAADLFRLAAHRLSVPYDVTVHDYLSICPRVNLIDATGFYCGEPDEAGCARCLSEAGSAFGAPPIWEWRDRYGRFLRGARTVFAPDRDVAVRLERYFPDVEFVVRAEPEAVPPASARAAEPQRAGEAPPRRRVGLIGALDLPRGSRLLLRCAALAKERSLPLDFVVVGSTDVDAELAALGVTIAGTDAGQDVEELVRAARLDLAWFPSVWPETDAGALSEAVRAGVFPVAFDIGALATRLRSLDWGRLFPVTWFFEPARIVEALMSTQPHPPSGREGEPALSSGPLAAHRDA